MGMYGSKQVSAEEHYTKLAVDFKCHLDNLEIFASALVQTTEGQTNLVNSLMQASQNVQTPRTISAHGYSNTNYSSHNVVPGGENVESKSRPSSGKNKQPNPKKSKKKPQESNTFQDGHNVYNTDHQSQYPTTGRALETNVDSPIPMETGSDELYAEGSTQKKTIPELFSTLGNMQKSTVSQACGLLQSIQILKSRIPEEISDHQTKIDKPSVNLEKLEYQIKVLEGSYAKTVNPILCRDMETQTILTAQTMEEEIRKLKEKLERMETMHRTNLNKIRGLEKELNICRAQATPATGSSYSSRFSNWSKPATPPRHKVMVQIYCRSRNDKLDAVNRELEQLLITQFDTINYDLTCTSCDKKEQLNAAVPVIVLCINASRLGTDVATSLEGLDRSSNMCVVILHHKDTHALPKQPSHRLLTGSEYKSLGGLIDMAFLSSKGVYPCDMNQLALNNLMTFIKGE